MRKKILYAGIAFLSVFLIHFVYSVYTAQSIADKWAFSEQPSFASIYFEQQNYLLGLSYALAGFMTVYAVMKFKQNKKGGAKGLIGGITLTGLLYTGSCFLLGCCGSPMLAVYLSLFGSSFLGFTKPLTLILTTVSVAVGFVFIEKKAKNSSACCANESKSKEDISAISGIPLEKIQHELDEGMKLKKCRQCGCMKETIEIIKSSSQLNSTLPNLNIAEKTDKWLQSIEPIKYQCLGCEYCYPAEALNLFQQLVPEKQINGSLSCSFEVKTNKWPVVLGEYFVLNDNSPIAVSTLASVELAEKIADSKPPGLCIIGKTETENIGIDKVIKNIVSNGSIRHLIIAGKEPKGHETGKTFLYLKQNGVDESMRVIGSPGKRPILRNVSVDEVNVFRNQVELTDLIGCENENIIMEKIKELGKMNVTLNSCGSPKCTDNKNIDVNNEVQIIAAEEPKIVEMDKAGYFVIIPQKTRKIITVEHYSYDNKLANIIEGENARSIYGTIIKKGWVTQLSHAAYIGRELERAELSMKYGFKYVQDGAGGSYYIV